MHHGPFPLPHCESLGHTLPIHGLIRPKPFSNHKLQKEGKKKKTRDNVQNECVAASSLQTQ